MVYLALTEVRLVSLERPRGEEGEGATRVRYTTAPQTSAQQAGVELSDVFRKEVPAGSFVALPLRIRKAARRYRVARRVDRFQAEQAPQQSTCGVSGTAVVTPPHGSRFRLSEMEGGSWWLVVS